MSFSSYRIRIIDLLSPFDYRQKNNSRNNYREILKYSWCGFP